MKKVFICVWIIALLGISNLVNAELLSKNFQFCADYAFYTKYISRGFTYDNDPVLQAGIYLTYKGLTLSIRNNMDIRNKEEGNSDEVDYMIDYTFAIKRFSLGLGLAYFDCPANKAFTKEYSVEIAYEYFLYPTLSWKHDFGDEDKGGGHGNYLVLRLNQNIPLLRGTSINLSGNIGYNSHYYIEGTGNDASLTVGLSLPLTNKLICTPNITYSVPYGDLADEKDGNQKSRLNVGIVMEY